MSTEEDRYSEPADMVYTLLMAPSLVDISNAHPDPAERATRSAFDKALIRMVPERTAGGKKHIYLSRPRGGRAMLALKLTPVIHEVADEVSFMFILGQMTRESDVIPGHRTIKPCPTVFLRPGFTCDKIIGVLSMMEAQHRICVLTQHEGEKALPWIIPLPAVAEAA